LQTAGRQLFKDINELIAAGKVYVNGKEIKLKFYLGGDYKVSPQNSKDTLALECE
jgi:hypothetical protein